MSISTKGNHDDFTPALQVHQPCPDCGSSDALSVYAENTYCFSCQKNTRTSGDTLSTPKVTHKGNLITDGVFKDLPTRGLTIGTCRKFGYTVGKMGNDTVQIANYFNKSNEVVAQKIRTKSKDFKLLGSLTDSLLFGQQLWKEGEKRIIITEGEIDAMSVSQVYQHKFPVVSIPNGASGAVKYIKQNLEWLESFDSIVIGFDTDKPGRDATALVAPLFTPGKAKVCTWDGAKDANEMLVNGNIAGIMTSISNAKEFRPDGILAGEDIWNAMMEKDSTQVFPTPYKELNVKLAGGMRRGRLYTITAGSGIGKSTFTKEIGYDLRMKHGLRLGVIALEESASETAHSFIGIHLNKPLMEDADAVTDEEKRKAFEEVILPGIYIHDHFGSLESDHLMNKIRYLAVAMECDFIILDHISIVISGSDEADSDERRSIDKLMTNLRSIVQETGVGMIIVSHLSNKKGGSKSHEDGGQVSLSELRGSGGIKQLSDFVIGLERNQQADNPNEATIRALKSRLGGRTGVAGKVTYNVMTGRMLPMDDQGDAKQTKVVQDDF